MRLIVAFVYFLVSSFCFSVVNADDNLISQNRDRTRTCAAVVKPVFYIIEKGDHLADIIRTFGFKPLYGNRSRVSQISELNEINDPNLIFPGQEVFLPFKCEEDTAKYVLIDRQTDRQISSQHLVKVKTLIKSNGLRKTVMRLPNGKEIEFDESSLTAPDQGNLARSLSDLRNQVVQSKLSEGLSKRSESAEAGIAREPSSSETGENLNPAKPQELNNYVHHSTFSFGGLYGFYRIDSKENEDGATALPLSRPSLGVLLGWDLNWSPNFSTGFSLAARSIEMRRASVGELTDGKQTTSGLGLNVQYKWTEKFKSILGINYEVRLYARATSNGNAIIEVYQQPSFDLKFEHETFRTGPLGLDFMLGYRQMLKTSTESASMYDSGEYLMGATFRQQLEKLQIELKVNYLKGELKSNLTNQDNSGIETQIGIKMEIGK